MFLQWTLSLQSMPVVQPFLHGEHFPDFARHVKMHKSLVMTLESMVVEPFLHGEQLPDFPRLVKMHKPLVMMLVRVTFLKRRLDQVVP